MDWIIAICYLAKQLVIRIALLPRIFYRCLRRRGRINEFVSVSLSEKRRTINISSDGGRVCRPYIIVEDGQPRVKQHHIQQLLDGIRNFEVGAVAIQLLNIDFSLY